MTGFAYKDLLLFAAPEAILTLTALVILLIDLSFLKDQENSVRRVICAKAATAGTLLAFFWTLAIHTQGTILNGMLALTPSTVLAKQCLLVLTAAVVLISMQSQFTEHVGEFFAVLLLGVVGMMFLISAEELLAIFLALEMTSLSLYMLAAFNKRSASGAEAAMKYFLFGGVAAAITLFGFSLLFGLAGTTNVPAIAEAIRAKAGDPLTNAAIAMVLVGFGFKVAAVPFHLWAPDAYQAAPASSAALIASGSKLAAFVALGKLLVVGLATAGGSADWRAQTSGWLPVAAVLAAASMIFGNIAAIAQTDVRRLLAYSAVAHAGYTIVGLMGAGENAIASVIYYVATYGAAVIGAFAVASVVEDNSGSARLSDFAGLWTKAPWLAGCLAVFMLSLAGIPPLAGFFGKFYLFTAAAAPKLGLLWLVVLAVAMSAVSLYYYLLVLKQVFVAEPSDAATLRTHPGALVGIILLAGVVIITGCLPDLLLQRMIAAH